MGNYLTVVCSKCEKEVVAEFREDLLQPQMIKIEECGMCVRDEAYEEGYSDGHSDGEDEAYKKATDAIKAEMR